MFSLKNCDKLLKEREHERNVEDKKEEEETENMPGSMCKPEAAVAMATMQVLKLVSWLQLAYLSFFIV